MIIIDFFKNNFKYILPIIGIVLIIVAGFFYYKSMQKPQTTIDETEFINFVNEFKFKIPDKYDVNVDSHYGDATIIMRKDYGGYSPNDYSVILAKDGMVIKTFPSFNKNDELFKKYVKEEYKSTEVANVEISFDDLNGNQVATITIIAKEKDEVVELIKIINSINPLIISSSGSPEAIEPMNVIIESIAHIDNSNKDFQNIKNQIKTFGALLKMNMLADIYSSLLSENLKAEISESDFISLLKESTKLLEYSINFSGGKLNAKEQKFIGKLSFTNPDMQEDRYNAKITLEKKNDKWLFLKIELPKDRDAKNLNQE